MGRNSFATLLPVFSIISCLLGLAHTALGVGLGERKCGVANGSIQNALLGRFHTELIRKRFDCRFFRSYGNRHLLPIALREELDNAKARTIISACPSFMVKANGISTGLLVCYLELEIKREVR